MRLTLRQLRYFEATALSGNITHAAEVLRVAPTALSTQIKAIEDDFGVALLRRHSRGIELTPPGLALLERARAILAQVADLEATLSRAGRVVPRHLRLGVPPAIARLIGAELVFGSAGQFPGLTIDLIEGWSSDLEARLRQREIDLLVGYGLTSDDTIHAEVLCEDVFIFAAAPTAIGGDGPIPLAEALSAGLVFYGARSIGLRATAEAARAAGLPPPPEMHVGSIDLWRTMLSRGLSATITTFSAIAEEHARGEIAVREIAGNPIRKPIVVAMRTEAERDGRFGPIRAFIAAQVDAARERLDRAVRRA